MVEMKTLHEKEGIRRNSMSVSMDFLCGKFVERVAQRIGQRFEQSSSLNCSQKDSFRKSREQCYQVEDRVSNDVDDVEIDEDVGNDVDNRALQYVFNAYK